MGSVDVYHPLEPLQVWVQVRYLPVSAGRKAARSVAVLDVLPLP